MKKLVLVVFALVPLLAFGQSAFNGKFPSTGRAIGGKDANGRMQPFVVNSSGNITVAPGDYSSTAFGEQRTAHPFTLLDLINTYGLNPRVLDTSVAGAGTVTNVLAESAIRLTVTGASGDSAKLRTNTYWRYQAGRGQHVFQTLYLSANAGADADQTVRWGYFDDNDGLFWRRVGGVLSFCRRTSVTGSPVDNCSTVTLPAGASLTFGNIWEIRFQWLGVGTVKAYWNGTLITTITNENTLSAPYMRTADLPLSWEIVNTAAADAATVTVICANVTSQGGSEPPEYGFAAERAAALTVSTTNLPVLSIRLASTFNTVSNRMVVLPRDVEGANANQPAWLGVYLNPATLTGPSWVAVDSTSGVEYDVTATAVAGGLLVGSCFLSSTADKCSIDLTVVFHASARRMRRTAFAGTSDVLTIVSRRTGTVDASVRATLAWEEIP